MLSIGGWGGSQYFSQAASSAANRSKFIGSMSSAVKTYGLAGVDIDWVRLRGCGLDYRDADPLFPSSFPRSLVLNNVVARLLLSNTAHNRSILTQLGLETRTAPRMRPIS